MHLALGPAVILKGQFTQIKKGTFSHLLTAASNHADSFDFICSEVSVSENRSTVNTNRVFMALKALE